ncbi:MAG: 50S ribosomal protein L4 [Clostridia bacterium]|nr:50S ribosomal protein L4 [Clostridia bacterium]
MPKVDIVNMAGDKVGEMELNDSVFGIIPNAVAIHTVVTAILANRRQGTQSALTRAEVSGGGIKPFRQKGTGRARQGSTRAPQWRHGGIVFAPKPRSYRKSVNKKVRQLAMRSALSAKVEEQDMIVLEDIAFSAPKTKEMVKVLNALGVDSKTLLVLDAPNEMVELSARNLPGLKTITSGTLNVYDIMNCNKMIVTKKAAQMVTEVYAK